MYIYILELIKPHCFGDKLRHGVVYNMCQELSIKEITENISVNRS